jgi:ABC-type uncharacterized transport system permease subunit
MRLVENWKQAWTWFSMWAMSAIVAIPSSIALLPLVWADMPQELKSQIPGNWLVWVLVGLAAAGWIGRLIDQKKVEKP